MDVLHDIFEVIQLRGTLYFRTDFSPPWGTTVPALGKAARFHFVVAGQCWLRIDGGDPTCLEAGDFVLIPNGASHVLSHAPDAKAPPLEQVLKAVGYTGESLLAVGSGDPDASTQLVCGHFNFDATADHPILRALPHGVVIRAASRAQRPWFDEALQLLVKHVFSNHPGSRAAVARLSEILFIEAVRSAEEEAPELSQLMRAFSDRRIGRALAEIHANPQRAWTVANLAAAAGMSRTRFATQFQELMGIGPIRYLTDWRLQRAAAALRNSRQSVAEIAYANGYRNATAFGRAFRERFGFPPGQLRNQAE